MIQHMSSLAGHETLATFTTSQDTVYCLSLDGRHAWPLHGLANAYGPYDADVARVCGHEVDATIPRDDYRVRAAGSDWLEVYEHLRTRR